MFFPYEEYYSSTVCLICTQTGVLTEASVRILHVGMMEYLKKEISSFRTNATSSNIKSLFIEKQKKKKNISHVKIS